MITKEQLVEMFKGMAKNTKWDLSKPMLAYQPSKPSASA